METADVFRCAHAKPTTAVKVATAHSSNITRTSGLASDKTKSSAFSLSLVAKKKEILQSEVLKLEACLRKRTELLCRLRQNREKLLTANGHLQERNRLRQMKLQTLGQALDASKFATSVSVQGGAKKDAYTAKDLDRAIEKLRIFKKLVEILTRRSTGLERKCMQLEEESLKQSQRVNEKLRLLSESEAQLAMREEDIRMLTWIQESERVVTAEAESRMSLASQRRQQEFLKLESSTNTLQDEQAKLNALAETRSNFLQMFQEDLSQLDMSKLEQQSAQENLRQQTEKPSIGCPEVEELERTEASLTAKLKDLNEGMVSTKFHAREARLQLKQGRDIISIKKANLKSKADQMNWLQRQYIYHMNELKELETKFAADEAAFSAFVSSYKEQSKNLSLQLKETTKSIAALDKLSSSQHASVAKLKAECQAKTEALLLGHDAANTKKQQLFELKVALSKLKVDAAHLEEGITQKKQEYKSLEDQKSSLELQNEDLQASISTVRASVVEAQQKINTKQEELKSISKISSSQLAQLGIKTRPNQQIKSIIKAIDQVSAKTSQDYRQDDDASLVVEQQEVEDKSSKLEERYKSQLSIQEKKYRKVLQEKEEQYHRLAEQLRQRADKQRAELPKEHAATETAGSVFDLPSDEVMSRSKPLKSKQQNRRQGNQKKSEAPPKPKAKQNKSGKQPVKAKSSKKAAFVEAAASVDKENVAPETGNNQSSSTHDVNTTNGSFNVAKPVDNFSQAKKVAASKLGEKASLVLSESHCGKVVHAAPKTRDVQDQFDFDCPSPEAVSKPQCNASIQNQRSALKHPLAVRKDGSNSAQVVAKPSKPVVRKGSARAEISQKSKSKLSQQFKKALFSRFRTTKKSATSASVVDWCADDAFSFD